MSISIGIRKHEFDEISKITCTHPKLRSGRRNRSVKPAIHYLQTWRIQDKIVFSPNKILLAKMRRTCCCTMFVVRRQFSHGRQFFIFDEKILCVCRRDRYPDANPAYSVTAKNLFAKHGKCLLYTIRRMLFFRRFTLISLLFANSV